MNSDSSELVLRTIVRLREEEDASFRDIGAELGISESAAYHRYKRYKDTDARETRHEAITINQEFSTSVSKVPLSVEEMASLFRVDLEVWEKERLITNKWEMGAKVGAKGQERITKVPLYQTKVWWQRINPIPLFPTIVPIQIETPQKRVAKRGKSKVKKALILADPQFGYERSLYTYNLKPFHDRRVLDLFIQIAEKLQPDYIAWLGDTLDQTDWTDHWVVRPEAFFTTQPALIECNWWLQRLRQACPSAEIDLFEGNHNRIENAIIRRLQAAYELRGVDDIDKGAFYSFARLLGLEALDIGFQNGYPNERKWLTENIVLRHGDIVRQGAGDTVKTIGQRTTITTIFGHIHRRELASRKIETREGMRIYDAFCPGCACHIDGRVPGSKADAQWQQGVGYIEYTDEHATIIPIPITEGKAIFQGEELAAQAWDKEISKMLGDKLAAIETSIESGKTKK